MQPQCGAQASDRARRKPLRQAQAVSGFQSYGYRTQFLLQQQEDAQNILADVLARQEIANNIRHLRNETAYQAVRNGLSLLFAAFLVFAATLAYQSL